MTLATTFKLALAAGLLAGGVAHAQLPLVPAANQEALLASADPKLAAKKSTTTWFDMLRIENGKIAEHRDCAPRQ
jgi:predicted SnoaL-like aldol condensation-catalyzing enzyme